MPPATLQRFNSEVTVLLKPKNPAARSLLAFIRRDLRQFHLHGNISETDIFIQAYLRGFEYCSKEGAEPIRNVRAWLRQTAFNIIREESRRRQRAPQVSYDVLAENDLGRSQLTQASDEWGLDPDIVEADMRAIVTALARLSAREQRIIHLRTLQGLAWKDVQQHLETMGEPPLRLDILRKQGQRALERLRKEYHTLRPPKP
ncbi:MAG: hypothetical protein IGR92_08650 [Leptolyngbyaceae cyanobacterium T60_A2020_046]|nr:hypothetical protein [Leptolyngbyaceae cyanobacterium T60_A2020_046]